MERLHESPYFIKISSSLLRADLPHSVKYVLAALDLHRNRQTGQCNPSVSRLSRQLGLSVRSVKYAIVWLRQVGVIAGRQQGKSQNEWYQIAPEERWRELIERGRQKYPFNWCKFCTSESTLTGASFAPALVQVLHSSPAVSITEKKTEKKREEQERECRAVRSVVGRPEQPPNGTARHASPDTLEGAGTEPAPQNTGLAEELLNDLAPAHPTPGMPRKALTALSDLLSTSDAPESLAARLRANHTAWLRYWESDSRFIPMLWKWIADGDWQYPPGAAQNGAQKKQPAKAGSFEQKVMEAAARVDARRRGQ